MNIRMFVKADIVPEAKTWYLTAGKEYQVRAMQHMTFLITDDNGDDTFCMLCGCPHLNGESWVLRTEGVKENETI